MNKVDELAAIEQIKRLKARYFRGVDTKDMDVYRSVFTPDILLDARGATADPVTGATLGTGDFEKVLSGVDEVVDAVRAQLAVTASVHHGYMPEIEILSENDARGIWAMSDRLSISEGDISHIVGHGHYHETYVRIGGEWKIKTLRLTRLRVDITLRSQSR